MMATCTQENLVMQKFCCHDTNTIGVSAWFTRLVDKKFFKINNLIIITVALDVVDEVLISLA